MAAGRFLVEGLTPDEHALAARLDEQYADIELGLADASVVILARRFRTTRLLSFDERDFRVVTRSEVATSSSCHATKTTAELSLWALDIGFTRAHFAAGGVSDPSAARAPDRCTHRVCCAARRIR